MYSVRHLVLLNTKGSTLKAFEVTKLSVRLFSCPFICEPHFPHSVVRILRAGNKFHASFLSSIAESSEPSQHLINVYIATSGLCFETFLKIRDREGCGAFHTRAPTDFGGGDDGGKKVAPYETDSQNHDGGLPC